MAETRITSSQVEGPGADMNSADMNSAETFNRNTFSTNDEKGVWGWRVAAIAWLVAALMLVLITTGGIARAADNGETAEAMSLGQLASYYRAYQRDVDAIDNLAFSSNTEIREAANLLKSFDPDLLSRGWLAHHALIAANSQGFVDDLNDASGGWRGKSRFLSRMSNDTSFLLTMPKADDALASIVSEISGEVSQMDALAERLEAKAYELMNASSSASPTSEEAQVTLAAASGEAWHTDYKARALLSRILTVAAHASLPDISDSPSQTLNALTEDKEATRCLRWAKLNLAQCMAASAFPSEEAYCAGKHGVAEVSACWSALAGEAASG